MSTIWRRAFHCDQCGREWLPEGETKPVQCPSRSCRSRQWDKDGGQHTITGIKDGQPITETVSPAPGPVAKLPPAIRSAVVPASSLPQPQYERPGHAASCKCGLCQLHK